MAYQSLEKSLAELAGLAHTQSAEASAADLLAQVRTFIDGGGGGGGDSGIIVSDSDPGAGNDFWLDTSGLQPVLKIRNAADDGWLVGERRWIDCGVITAAGIVADGRQVLYTTAAGEFVAQVRFGDALTLLDQAAVLYVGIEGNDTLYLAQITPSAASVIDSTHNTGGWFNDDPGVTFAKAIPVLSGVLIATITPAIINFIGANPSWQANHAYTGANFNGDATACIIASAHMWEAMSPGTSGGSAPDFAGNIGGNTPADGTISGWLDVGLAPTAGSGHVYAEIIAPFAPADNAKLLPDVTDGVSTITAPGTLEVGSGLVLTEPTPGTALIEADIPAIPVKLFEHFTDGANVTTGETDLYSDTLAAGQLAANGDVLELVYAGLYAGSATATAALKLYFGGTVIFNSGALAVSAASNWTIRATLIRVSASIIRYSVTLQSPGLAVVAPDAVGELTGLDLTATQIVKITGQAAAVGAASNQITAKLGAVTYVP